MKLFPLAMLLVTIGLASAAHAQEKDVVAATLRDPQFSTWARIVKKSGMDSTLKVGGSITLFVPTNAAFAKLPAATRKILTDNTVNGKQEGAELVMRHIVAGQALRAADLKPGLLNPMMGPPILVKAVPGGVTVNNAHIVRADLKALNGGIIHAVDRVFLTGKQAVTPQHREQ